MSTFGIQGLGLNMAGGIDFGTINSTLNQMIQSSEGSLNSLLTTVSQKPTPSTTDMLSLQQALQNWTVMIQTSSTTTKDLYDALKEIVQKAG
ncbi:MAG: EscF/YscF/HrpA family type III secretion system needle major subunit [Gammaproteobacteria bacterium]